MENDGFIRRAMLENVCEALSGVKRRDPMVLAPLSLAYIGDTIYDLYVRTELLESSDLTSHGMHMLAASRVCAAAQARAAMRVMDMLSDEELSVFKRGRNSHMATVPKNASMADYRAATGLEALFGYLYLAGRDERLTELMRKALKRSD